MLGGYTSTGFLVRYTVIVKSRGLVVGFYTPYQTELSNRVVELRDGLGLTFKGIAELLISEGYRSPRGFDLGPESVFSIYKKRKIRDNRLTSRSRPEISEVTIEYVSTDTCS